MSALSGGYHMDSLVGRTIRWVFDDGPMAGTTVDHRFGQDGSVTWSIHDGPHKGASMREETYAATAVNDKTWVVSYRAASGHTLTAVLNVDDHGMLGFGSDQSTWVPMRGKFELLP